MNVLYISYDGLTDPLGQSQVLPYLQHLSRHGYRFTILSFEKAARFQKEGAAIRNICAQAGIDWVPLDFTVRPPVLSKMYDRLRMRQTAERLHRQKSFALVHCRSYVAAEVGLLLKKKYGIRFLFDMRGFWADEKVDNGQWPQHKAFYRSLYGAYKKKEAQFLLQADGIISLTEAAKSYLKAQPQYRQLDIGVIPCCADLDHFDYRKVAEADVARLREKIGIPAGTPVVTYLGSIGGWYMTGEMFRFYRLLKKRHPQAVLLVLTKDDPATVRAEAAAEGIGDQDLRVTYATRNQVPLYQALSTASLFFIRNTFSKTASSPTKHAELMAMGVPVICNDIGDTGNIIRATGTGILVEGFDDASLQKAVDGFDGLAHLNKAHIRDCARQYFDLAAGAEKYLGQYQHILTGSKEKAASMQGPK